MSKIHIPFLTFLLFSLSTSAQIWPSKSDRRLEQLFNLMQGEFSSEKQSIEDSTYFNISLRMTPIWKDRGHFLYVEQAMFENQDKPYRVRIYRLSRKGRNEFISEVFTLRNEQEWIGKWKTPDSFDALSLDDLELKSGCEVVLIRHGRNKFIGETGATSCKSELRGASYATSKVSILKNKILSWDQGFNNEGKQVWGATKGGYIFEKL